MRAIVSTLLLPLLSGCFIFLSSTGGIREHFLLRRSVDDPTEMSPRRFKKLIQSFQKSQIHNKSHAENKVEKTNSNRTSPPLTDKAKGVNTQVADGKFNGFDLYYTDHPPVSHIHCVGENFQKSRSHLYRSCEYSNLCYDVDQKEFVAFVDPTTRSISQTKNAHVLAGAQPKSWYRDWSGSDSYKKGVKRSRNDKRKRRKPIGRYSPIIYTDMASRPSSYYRMRQNVTLLPFYAHPTSYRNPGHVLWDDFLSLYNLLDIFARADDSIFLMQMIRPTVREFGYEYFQEVLHDEEDDVTTKFLTLFLGADMHSYSIKERTISFEEAHPRWRGDEPKIICAEHAVMGNGLLSDHGEKNWHGQIKSDYENPHNYGRGGLLRRYRSWLLKNAGLSTTAISRSPRSDPYLVLVSMHSSNRRNFDFAKHTQVLRNKLGTRADVRPVEFPKMNVSEQIALASRAAVIVSTVGGGSSTAFFLPRGSSLCLFHPSEKRLDWDLWNNMPDIHVHWLPLKQAESNVGALVDLVMMELDYLDSQTAY